MSRNEEEMVIIYNLIEKAVTNLGGTKKNIHCLVNPKRNETIEKIAQIIMNETKEIENTELKLVFEEENLIIDACDGKEDIKTANDLFTYIDSPFKSGQISELGKNTAETSVRMYEVKGKGSWAWLFKSLYPPNIEKLCFTQAQIINFIRKNLVWLLTDVRKILFLLNSNLCFFIIDVHFNPAGKIEVFAEFFDSGLISDFKEGSYMVIPKLSKISF